MTDDENARADWPLGKLLADARGRMSQREAARRADISASRWRQVEMGVQRVAGSIDVPVNVKATTVARMALAVGADPSEALRLAGHDPSQYADLISPELADLPPEVRRWFTRLPAGDRAGVLEKLQRLDAESELRGLGESKKNAG